MQSADLDLVCAFGGQASGNPAMILVGCPAGEGEQGDRPGMDPLVDQEKGTFFEDARVG